MIDVVHGPPDERMSRVDLMIALAQVRDSMACYLRLYRPHGRWRTEIPRAERSVQQVRQDVERMHHAILESPCDLLQTAAGT